MEKRLLIAVVLSILVMLVYPVFIARINPPPAGGLEQSVQLVERKEAVETYRENAIKKADEVTLPAGAISRSFINNKYEIDFSNIGGSIQRIKIKDGKSLDIDLVEKALFQQGMLSIEGSGPLSGLSSQPFEIKEDTKSLYIEKDGLLIEKSIRFVRDKYAIIATVNITNLSPSTKHLSFELTTASKISNKEKFETRYVGTDVLYRDGKLKRIASGNSKKYNKLYHVDIEWLALRNKYYSIIAKPEFQPAGIFTKNINNAPVVGFILDGERIIPGETKAYRIIYYIGPTEMSELNRVDPLFGKALNFGMLTSISLVLLGILRFFFAISHNYGVAILLLTCCVSFLLFPLSFKSLKSMRRMQEIQPHIEKVRQEHKDNPHKLNKEIMELYRRYNVNPMGGCFPMLLQMPIFIALYQTLMRSVELKGAHFLWIKDLSMPDAAFHLPFTMPFLGNAINLLPILMIGAMILQQQLSQHGKASSSQADQQKMMARIMPIMFGFIFYNLPSGLVLYWLTNTLLTSGLQFFFLKKS